MVLVRPSKHKLESSSALGEKVPHKIYQTPYDDAYIEKHVIRKGVEEGWWRLLISVNELSSAICDLLLKNTELLQDLRNFDLIVYDQLAPCTALVAEHLGIPTVLIIPVSPSIAKSYFMIPHPVSYVPLMMTAFTSKMSFTQRLGNLGAYIFSEWASYFLFVGYLSPVKEKYNISPEISCFEALGNVELMIIEADFAFEYPQPLLPGNCLQEPMLRILCHSKRCALWGGGILL